MTDDYIYVGWCRLWPADMVWNPVCLTHFGVTDSQWRLCLIASYIIGYALQPATLISLLKRFKIMLNRILPCFHFDINLTIHRCACTLYNTWVPFNCTHSNTIGFRYGICLLWIGHFYYLFYACTIYHWHFCLFILFLNIIVAVRHDLIKMYYLL